MAGTCPRGTPHVIGSSVGELARTGCRAGASLSVRISSRSYAVAAAAAAARNGCRRVEGPSCIFIGPVETASQENLEALYRQVSVAFANLESVLISLIINISFFVLLFLFSFKARDAYYSGEPLIVDDMFDRVEVNSA